MTPYQARSEFVLLQYRIEDSGLSDKPPYDAWVAYLTQFGPMKGDTNGRGFSSRDTVYALVESGMVDGETLLATFQLMFADYLRR